MSWFIGGNEYFDIDEATEAVCDAICESQYDEYLNSNYGELDYGNVSFAASYILAKLDKDSYDIGFKEWKESISKEVEVDLQRMYKGDEALIFGVKVTLGEDAICEICNSSMRKYRVCGDRNHPLIQALRDLNERDKGMVGAFIEVELFDGYEPFVLISQNNVEGVD